jgi:oligosaccharide repeat unit polymerase
VVFPFYLNAVIRIVDGSKFAKVNFYLALRHEFVFNNANLGILDYINTFSIFAFAFFQYKLNFTQQPQKKSVLFIAYKVLFYLTVFTYAFLTTGRTSFVFLLTIYLVFKATAKTIKRYHISVASIFFLIIFIANAFILGKGASVDDSVSDNTSSILDNFTIYFLGGVYGFDSALKSGFILDFGENVFRFFIAVAHSLGISSLQPKKLVMPYITTPILSNVYTLYFNYFKDFSYFGLLFNCIYSVIHTIFYNKTQENNKFINIYFFAILMYPLIMSFFQDQYMSLFSTWIQLTFYGLIASFFVTSEKKIVV